MAEFIHAQWWQPAEPARKLPGVLFQDDNQAWLLHLDGSFEELSSTASGGQSMPITLQGGFPILLGRTSTSKFITAFGCDTQSGRGSLELRPTILAHGVHFEDESDFALTSLAARFSNFDSWTDTSGFTISHTPASSDTVKIEYTAPSPVEAALRDGISVGIAFRPIGMPLRLAFEVHIVQRAWVTVRTSGSPRGYEEMLRFCDRFGDFVALAVGEPLRRLELNGTCNVTVTGTNEIKACPFVLVDNRNPLATGKREVAAGEMLFTLNEIRSRFAEIVQAWFTKSEDISPLYNLYFSTLRSPFMYLEHRFLSMFQALEAYHRQTRKVPDDQTQKHEARLYRISQAVCAQDEKWLRGKLRHSNEPNAEQRIRELTKQQSADWLLTPEDVERAALLRNFNTHFSPDVEKRLPAHGERTRPMHRLAVRLQVLCEMILLDRVGFPDVRQQVKWTERLKRREAD